MLRRRAASESDIKEIVRERDGFKCADCGMTEQQHYERFGKTLDVHRIDPGSIYTIAGCVSLCRPCHTTKPKSPLPRKAIDHVRFLIPKGWEGTVTALAKRRQQPINWYLISTLEKAAKSQGMEALPNCPWE